MNEVSVPSGTAGCMSASCTLNSLQNALLAGKITASYAPSHTLFLVAEPPSTLYVLASCERMTLRYRLGLAQVEGGGTLELSFRSVQLLVRQFERSRRGLGLAKRADCPVRVTTEAIAKRARTFLTCTVTLLVPPYARTCVVDAASLGKLPEQDLLRAQEECAGAQGPVVSEQATGQLPARALKRQLQRCLFAARAGLPLPPSLQVEPAPYYGVLLSLQAPEASGSPQARADWHITCTAQGPHQLATAQERLFPAPLATGSTPLPSEMLLPSWASAELAPLLPIEGSVELRVGRGGATFHTAELDLLAEFVQDRPAAPPRPGTPPDAQVAVNAPHLLRALKQTTRRLLDEHIGDGGMPPDRRLITLDLDPAQGRLHILPEVAGYDTPPFKTSLHILEGRGSARSVCLSTWDVERAIAQLGGSVLLALYDEVDQFPLVVRPLVPTGFQCWFAARTRPSARAAASND
jgi:hypothetical protein